MTESASRPTPCDGGRWASVDFEALLAELRRHSADLEQPGASAAAQLDRMASVGVMRWGIPVEHAGSDLGVIEQTEGISQIAAHCLVSAFVLSQRNAAVTRIAVSDNESLKADLLPRLARHDVMATVGISHLTTSRQHLGRPAVSAKPEGEGYILDGVIPWVTAGGISDVILTGGTLADGRQLLGLVSSDDPGVTVGHSTELLALNASQTGPVSLAKVRVRPERVVAHPVEGVMKSGGAGTGSVTTSALAVGLAAQICGRLSTEARRREDLHEIDRAFFEESKAIWRDIRALLAAGSDAVALGVTSESIRQRANSLVLRASQAYLAASKGAGFVKGHPAERAVREAMFFLVWSCPQPVVDAALRRFACLGE